MGNAVSVYVDDMYAPYGRMIMCHMIADTSEELRAMVAAIGVKRKWIQDLGSTREHFDVCLTMRARAVALGAKEISRRELVRLTVQKRKKWFESLENLRTAPNIN